MDIDKVMLEKAKQTLLLGKKSFDDIQWEFRRVVVIRDCHTYWYLSVKSDPALDMRVDKGLPY
jgi:hypothetical protein